MPFILAFAVALLLMYLLARVVRGVVLSVVNHPLMALAVMATLLAEAHRR